MKAEDRKSADADTVWHALVDAEPPHNQSRSIISYFETFAKLSILKRSAVNLIFLLLSRRTSTNSIQRTQFDGQDRFIRLILSMLKL